ncbi:MAG TPA: penicillin-binding transpeptidase domain-containing protein [Caulobacteraceae bacterium]|nr:penicillin-binding transpeptidase domain-containing protein [Caulobacteraceae bacterium]
MRGPRLAVRPTLRAGLLAMVLAACAPVGGKGGAPALDQDKLEAAVGHAIGGGGTCVVLNDVASGRILYQYGNANVCMRGLPPCATFDIANDLIGLDLGAVTPATVFKWDGTPQPVKAWEADADLAKAFRNSIGWWQGRLAIAVGHDRYVEQLKALDYGTRDPAGPVQSFWMGSRFGGGLWISTREQADFLRRFYAGRLPVKPEAAALVRQLMVDEIRTDAKGGQFVVSGRAGDCATVSDNSRSVGWWVGRLKTPTRDLAFAVSFEGDDAPPGAEVRNRVKDVFADAGLWPAER